MNLRFRTVFVCLVASLLLIGVGCDSEKAGDKTDKKSQASASESAPSYPAFFKEIPADSLYVYTSLEPFPKEFMTEQLERAEKQMGDSWADSVKNLAGEGEMPKGVEALIDEIAGNMSPEGFEKLGLSTEPTFAFYGVGGLPVLRMKLGDEKAFTKTVERIESKSESPPEKKKSDGVSYRLFKADEIRIPMVIRDGEVVLGVAAESKLDTILPWVLGKKNPETSLADKNDLEKIAKKYGYKRWAVGRVDVERAVRQVVGLDDRGPVLKEVLKGADEDISKLSEDCKKEIGGMAAAAPRFVMGVKSYEAGETVGEFGVELESGLAKELSGIAEPVPAGDSELFDGALLGLGVGLNVAKFKKMAEGRMGGIAEKPYKCEHFKSLNEMAGQYKEIPVPPQAAGLLGASIMLDDIEFGSQGFAPSKVSALAIVRAGDAKKLFDSVKPMVPGLAQADVKADGKPVALSQLSAMAGFLEEPHITLTKDALAISTGKGMKSKAASLAKGSASEGPKALMAMSYDFDKLMKAVPESTRKMLKAQMSGSLSMEGSAKMRLEVKDSGLFMTASQRISGGEKGGDSAK